MSPQARRTLLGIGLLSLGALILAPLALAEKEPGAEGERASQADKNPGAKSLVTTETLGGAERYLTHVSTDKPIYRPGENLYVRGTILSAADHKPLEQAVGAMVQVQGPKGDVIAGGWVHSAESVVGFKWEIPEEQPGGEYTIKVSYPHHGYAPAERKFDIRAYRAPRLKSQIVFIRDGYGPGDEVGATLHVERAEGGIPAGAQVTAIARVDGEQVFRGPAKVDDEGNCEVRFPLPEQIARGDGTLALVIEDGGVVETASKTIPILLQTVDLQLYPEGGNLVAGLPTRVYLEAKTPAQKPADLAGVIVDSSGKEVAEFRSEHEGRGRFEITPAAGEKYTLKITEPSGIKTTYPLPEVQAQGAVLTSAADVISGEQPVKLQVAATADGSYRLTLNKREVAIASRTVEVAAGKMAEVELTPPAHADGVLIATLWSAEDAPLAERLIYRQPAHQVQVSISADQSQYTPGGQAALTVRTTDENGQPISAVVGLTVTDDSVLEMIEKREQAPRLPVMVLLEDDVQELSDAHVYLDSENPEAPLALDLLLGTQGWRRYALMNTQEFLKSHGDAGRRVLALRMATPRMLHLFGGVGGAAVPQSAAAEGVPADNNDDGAKPQGEAFNEPDQDEEEAKRPEAAAPEPSAKPNAPPREERAGGQKKEAANVAGDRPAAGKQQGFADEEARDRKELRRALVAQEELIEADALFDRAPMPMENSFLVVREYAHQVREGRRQGDRSDFTETLYWNAGVKTDAKTGEAQLRFGLSDSVTSFRVLADSFSKSGSLGSGTSIIEVVEPFYLEPKMPLEVTSGDVIQLPIAVVNATGEALDTNITVTAGNGQTGGYPQFQLAPQERRRRLFTINAADYTGPMQFTFAGQAGSYADQVTRPLNVKPLGFPAQLAFGGMLESDDHVTHEIVIPADVVAGSLRAEANVYPTPLANLTAALERLIREPSGCFEQTSSTTYPLVMAQQYFQSHTGVDPALIQRSNDLLNKGYKRLMSFECKEKGYEWFGQDPGHEALSAYGLLEFTDMSRVHPVDEAMLARTRKWLLSQRDGNGGFKRERRALHTWLADADLSNAYITWALQQAGESKLQAEVDAIEKAAADTKNSYVLALSANVLQQADRADEAKKLLDQLASKQHSNGYIDGATSSIVGSGGDALKIETTSLALLAWLRDPAYAGSVEKAMKYLANSCESGRFGSTQSTVLALKAIVEYDKSRAHPKAAGSVQLVINDEPLGELIVFDEKTQGSIQLPDFASQLKPGSHKVELRMADGSQMPYSLTVNYNGVTPVTSDQAKMHVAVSLTKSKVEEGGITEAQIRVTNTASEIVPTPVAIIGLPGGLEVRHDQLKELVAAERIAAYEVIGREVVLYWRSMQAEADIELPLSLVAAVPGKYTGPASRAYLYYTDEHKHWSPGLKVEITPKSGEK